MSVAALDPECANRPGVFFGWPDPTFLASGSVVTVGVFDGFHLGHEALLARTVARARSLGLPAVLVTFTPHPRAVLAPDAAPRVLMRLEDRIDHALSLGADNVVLLPFTTELAGETADQFVETGLVGHLQARLLVVGANFRCGRGGNGDVAVLAGLGEPLGMRVEAVDLVAAAGMHCSSTELRRRLASGDLAGARALLGRDDPRVLTVTSQDVVHTLAATPCAVS
jgi:riboflavin kinase/FMN adenylyltransferase